MKLIFIIIFSFLFTKDVLAVLDFESIGISNEESYIVTQSLITNLILTEKYTIIERGRIDKILKEQKFQKSGCTDSECAVEVGQLINADFVALGSVSKLGSTYLINARIIDVESGEAINSAQSDQKGTIDVLLKAAEFIAEQLTGINIQDKKRKQKQNSRPSKSAKNKTSYPKLDPNKIYNIPIGDSYVKGNKNAPITMIKFTDFQ